MPPSLKSPPQLLGCHLSIAGGLSAAVERADALGNRALQIFTHSPSTWYMRTLSSDEIAVYRARLQSSGVKFVAVHTLYLLNLATPDEGLYRRSIRALVEEVRRAALLGADAVVTHIGHSMGTSADAGLRRAVDALREVVTSTVFQETPTLTLAVENTAGSGTSVGHTFRSLSTLLTGVGAHPRVGLCFDTCHAAAAGYDLRTPEAVNATFAELDESIGWKRLVMVHLNDAVHPLGSHRDRHTHIGDGTIGDEGMKAILRHRVLEGVPVILETPKKMESGEDADPINLARVRRLYEESAV
jgi:deoxyribonuclease IV